MRFKPMHKNFIAPTKGSNAAGGRDIYMPEAGSLLNSRAVRVKLGFAAEVPPGHVALMFPRSSTGTKHGLELNNTCGVIDSDYRGEWMATLTLKTNNQDEFHWAAGDRVLQYLIVPVLDLEPEVLKEGEELSSTERGEGGFGSSGK